MQKTHILVIRFSALGDVAMVVPVVYSLAQQYPQVRITVLSRPFARTFFADLAPNVNFMEADLKDEYRGVKGLNALYRRLVAKQFTHVADLHSVLRSRYLRMRFNMGRFRVEHLDKHRRQRRQLVSQHKGKPLPTSFDNYFSVFAKLGFPITTPTFTSIFPPEGGNLNLLPRAIGPKLSWEHWIGIAPFAAHEGKVYPPQLMEQVIRQLSQDHPKARLFLFGRGCQEEHYFKLWAGLFPQCTIVANHTENMQQELILMSHLDVMLSMDSANMHMASLTGTTVVSIWGATHPSAGFLGWRQSADNTIGADMDCRPCSIYGQKKCKRGNYPCMHNIAPSTIINKLNQILKTP